MLELSHDAVRRVAPRYRSVGSSLRDSLLALSARRLRGRPVWRHRAEVCDDILSSPKQFYSGVTNGTANKEA